MREGERWKAWRRFAAFDRPHRRHIEGGREGRLDRGAPGGSPHGRTHGVRHSGCCDGGEIAVRAHRHLPQGMCDSCLRHALPQRPKHMGMATAGEPGPRRPAMGVAGTRSGTGPDGCRAQGLEGVGESGSVCRITRRMSCHGGHGCPSHGGSAGTVVACGAGNGERRDGFPDADGRTPLAIIGSGHCLQSRISHDSFLVGYDWGELGCGRSGNAMGASAIGSMTGLYGHCIARVLRRCLGP